MTSDSHSPFVRKRQHRPTIKAKRSPSSAFMLQETILVDTKTMAQYGNTGRFLRKNRRQAELGK